MNVLLLRLMLLPLVLMLVSEHFNIVEAHNINVYAMIFVKRIRLYPRWRCAAVNGYNFVRSCISYRIHAVLLLVVLFTDPMRELYQRCNLKAYIELTNRAVSCNLINYICSDAPLTTKAYMAFRP